jgi:hypothetical protein
VNRSDAADSSSPWPTARPANVPADVGCGPHAAAADWCIGNGLDHPQLTIRQPLGDLFYLGERRAGEPTTGHPLLLLVGPPCSCASRYLTTPVAAVSRHRVKDRSADERSARRKAGGHELVVAGPPPRSRGDDERLDVRSASAGFAARLRRSSAHETAQLEAGGHPDDLDCRNDAAVRGGPDSAQHIRSVQRATELGSLTGAGQRLDDVPRGDWPRRAAPPELGYDRDPYRLGLKRGECGGADAAILQQEQREAAAPPGGPERSPDRAVADRSVEEPPPGACSDQWPENAAHVRHSTMELASYILLAAALSRAAAWEAAPGGERPRPQGALQPGRRRPTGRNVRSITRLDTLEDRDGMMSSGMADGARESYGALAAYLPDVAGLVHGGAHELVRSAARGVAAT